ncbi:hypothetical protein CJU89_6554 [Yarrowia sp. B02]|nr:hypothetical protein CJU89_6554 [Yarrowia sp. B02]
MKFSIATVAALAALALAAPADADPAAKFKAIVSVTSPGAKAAIKVPEFDIRTDGVTLTAVDSMARAFGQANGISDVTIFAPDLSPAEIYKLYTNLDMLETSLNDLVDYAAESHAADWKTAISITDSQSALPALLYELKIRVNKNSYTAEDISNAALQVYRLYMAEQLAASAEKSSNGRVKLVQNYHPKPQSTVPAAQGWDYWKVSPRNQTDIDQLTKQFSNYVKEQTKIHDALAAQQQSADPVVADVSNSISAKVDDQTNKLSDLQKQIDALKQQLAASQTPAVVDTTSVEAQDINKALDDASKKQEQVAEDTKAAAEATNSEALKAIAAQLQAQADALKNLFEGATKPADQAPEAAKPAVVAPAAESPSPAAASPAAASPAAASPAAASPDVESPSPSPAVESPAVASPAVESPAVASPAVESPAVASPAVESPAVASPAVESPVASPVASPAAPATPANAVSNSNSNSNSNSSSNSSSNAIANANANVGIFFIGANGQPVPAAFGNNGTFVNGTDTYITIYESDCPVTTTDAAGATITTLTKTTVTSTVCPKCTKTPASSAAVVEKTAEAQPNLVEEEKDDVVTVFVTDCPVTSVDAAGSTYVSHSQSTVTSTVCTKCTKKAAETPVASPKPSPKAEQPKEIVEGDKTVRLTQTLTHTLKGEPSAPAQAPEHIPAQANSAAKAVAGAAMALPMLAALL